MAGFGISHPLILLVASVSLALAACQEPAPGADSSADPATTGNAGGSPANTGRIEERPHKYVEDGKYLRLRDEAGDDGVLLFATDGHGKVTEWRIGVPPQVDYVEGCS